MYEQRAARAGTARAHGGTAGRGRPADERGFTLVELLVVMVIIGILAAVATGTFVNQKGKAQDAEAKEVLRTAQHALHVLHQGSGTFNQPRAALEAVERSLVSARNLTIVGTSTTFTLAVDSASPNAGGTFNVTHAADGRVTRDCTRPGHGGCRAALDAAGNRW